ncbi:MAG: hypothetical protein JRJ84_14695 [Deltaproteobacteria bacterium]|nr:hypothetical protein [Deltaproteobacteria bacterium]
MDWRWLTALLLVGALGLVVLAVVVAPEPGVDADPSPTVDVAPLPSGPAATQPAIPADGGGEALGEREAAGTDSEAPEPLVGPNGQPLPPGTKRPQAGLPDRGPPQAPLDDAEAWQQVRTEAARTWREQSFEVAARFADEQGLSAAEREGMFEGLQTYHDDLEAVRADIEAGRTHPAEGRASMSAIRARAATDLAAVLGSEQTAELREALSTLPGGGF